MGEGRAIALFGEAQKGDFCAAYYCRSLIDLSEYLGEPPNWEVRGLQFAIQSLLYEQHVVFFRVREEGFSKQDYLNGLNTLTRKELFPKITALCLPGVGDAEIIQATDPILALHKSCLIMSQEDLYDYLTG